jgi:predicted Fe-Mo cluster-binding NifX family protein
MRFAISTDSGMVSEHFGRCPEFTLVDVEDNKVIKKEVVANPGHVTGFIPKFLHERGVECIIAGGMGWRAQGFFDEFGIKTIVGVTGKVDDVIDMLLKGTLKGGESLCKPQSGKGYGIEKEDRHHD